MARSASADQIRSAYRKLVLQHHPDRSKDPGSRSIFLAVTASYEVLSDPEAKRQYDERLKARAAAPKPGPRTPPQASAPRKPETGEARSGSATATVPSIAEEIQRLTKLYQTGRQSEAETKAHEILKRDSRQSMPYAILGDIARGKGNVNEAAKMYAYAMQMDPRNSLYERRYREILDRSNVVSDSKRTRLEPEDRKVIVPMIGGAFVILIAMYLGLSRELPAFGWLPPISKWTISSVVCMFIAGGTVGASLSTGNLVDRYGSVSISPTGGLSPSVALGCFSIVQFWFAAGLYAAVALAQKAWNFSMARLILGVAIATLVLALASCLNANLDPVQIFCWGGNVVYVGALCGWIVADAFR